MSRNTKIVATYGPAVASNETLTALVQAGVDVVRLNMSHGDHAQHKQAIAQVRQIAAEVGRPVALLLDLRGPKIRVGTLAQDPQTLVQGNEVVLVTTPGAGHPGETLPIEGYPALGEDVKAGERILLDDGAIRLRVLQVGPIGIRCEIEVGGDVRSRRGVNLPQTHLRSLATLTAKDLDDLELGLAHGVDYMALSFVRSAQDVQSLKERIAARGASIPVIAKIEKREALEDLSAIVASADGIMVARGDLGVETALEEVALRQKEIIRACNRQGKVVITATQMLESMIAHATPTRAEVSDISNAIFDGTDALMLSGETAIGAHPVEAVAIMARIAERTETALDGERLLAQRPFLHQVPDAVAHAACVTAHEIEARALVCLTHSGNTARLVSRYRPKCPVIAFSPDGAVVRRLAIVWGVTPVQLGEDLHGEELIAAGLAKARETGLVREGDRVVITAGVSAGALRGQTNLVRVETL